jgi:D-xylose transport system permease protein
LVFVLLLGEIDLSVGYVSAIAGVFVARFLTAPNFVPWYIAIPIALIIAAGVGWVNGFLITFFQLPAFIVTLATLLVCNGLVLQLIGLGGTVRISDEVVNGLANARFTPEQGWLIAIIVVGLLVVNSVVAARSRQKQSLSTIPMPIVVVQIVVMAVVIGGLAWIGAQTDPVTGRPIGVPVVAVILFILLVVLTFLAERTRFGRYVYAIGGNKEAARRAGIRVERIRIMVFMLCSMLAGLGGIILASRLRSVSTDAGGGNLLLNAVASAVIGGTSLFGGRGKVSSAILGALVIAGVDNGMGLLKQPAAVQYIVTGVVLLLAVVVDAIARRSQKQSGLA